MPPTTLDLPKKTAPQKRRAKRLFDRLAEQYPDAHCALNHRNAYELLIATILSAQCTDAAVNKATPALFAQYPTPAALADADLADVEALVRTCGFYRNKAKNIVAAAVKITEDHAGKIPPAMESLLQLPGVARKTANVVLGNAFNINLGVVVDTHVGRISHRLGLTDAAPKNAIAIEKDLMALLPRDTWTLTSHLMISHGRAVCDARKPDCNRCTLKRSCPKAGVTDVKP